MPLARDASRAAWSAARRRTRTVTASDVGGVGRRYRIDDEWRRTTDGRAARLGFDTTIGVGRPVGRWRGVDARVPQDGWRSPWKTAGLVVWGSALGAAWWLGSSKGRGPLASLQRDDDRV